MLPPTRAPVNPWHHRTSGVDVHHEQLRFAWELQGPDGAIAAAGIDVGGLASDGRLARINGFFG